MKKTVEDDIFCGKNKLLIELSSEVIISQNKMKVDILLNLDMYRVHARITSECIGGHFRKSLDI